MNVKSILKHSLLLLIIFPVFVLAATKLNNVTIKNSSITFSLDFAPSYKFFILKNPNRLVVDFSATTLNTKLPQQISSSIFKTLRWGESKTRLRLVFELANTAKFQSKVLGRNPYKLQLYTRVKPQTKSVPIISLNRSNLQQKLRNIIVVVDPGHGGKDPGATGPRGTHEKNVVLAISKDLQSMLDAQSGFHAELTRKGDYFIPLRQRLSIARKDHGDMFIAIHADAYRDRDAEGASVFALSLRGATSEAARWLARKENESELGHVLQDKNNTLKSVLINLAQTASISTSLRIGSDIIGQLHKFAKLHHDRVEQAAFVVLKEPDIPSLLVETGFISNAKEESRLNDPDYQHRIAKALMLGIVNYFKDHPPRGTYIYAHKYS